MIATSPAPEATASGVLFCHICRKPFSQKGPLNRHTAYCRRASARPRVRPRPCRECSTVKQKCSLDEKCSRCLKKGLACIYPGAAGRPGRHDTSSSSDDAMSLTRVPPPSDLFNGELYLEETAEESQRHVATSVLDDFSPSSHMRSPGQAFDFSFSDSASRNEALSVMDLNSFQFDMGKKAMQIPAPIAPPIISPFSVMRPVSAAARVNSNLILQTLRSFPAMMLRRSTFPPFIHQSDGPLPTRLANCVGIAAMFASRTDDTRPFLWRAVREEQERAVALAKIPIEMVEMNDLLAATQAQLIYLMMRVIDGRVRDLEYDQSMIVAFHKLCLRCNEKNIMDLSPDYALGLTKEMTWEQWIVAESRSRLSCIWFLVAQVVSVRVAMQCNFLEFYRTFALPCAEALWTARSEEAWRAESAALVGSLHTYQDLIDVHADPNGERNAAHLDAWNAAAGSLGFMLNVATTLEEGPHRAQTVLTS